MTKVKDIAAFLENIAPIEYQESYDNVGIIVGNKNAIVQGILICLDITEEVILEAKEKNCNLIISHHPIIFNAIKKITTDNATGSCIMMAIKYEITIYTLHTNLDNIIEGVNQNIAQTLKLENVSVILPKANTLYKIVTFVPLTHTNKVREAMHRAGAGNIGNYSQCSFISDGIGTFKPSALANPHIGSKENLETTAENRVEMRAPLHLKDKVISALKNAHPYEEAVYYLQKLEICNPKIGSGIIGELANSYSNEAFLRYLKDKMSIKYIRHSKYISRPIKRVAICGGSGSILIKHAIKQKTDAIVTADIKYHDFFDAKKNILIADIGHYESEVGIKKLLYSLLGKTFNHINIIECDTVTNPIYYF